MQTAPLPAGTSPFQPHLSSSSSSRQPLHPEKYYSFSTFQLHDLFLLLVGQRLPRPGADLEHPADFVEQLLVLARLAALQTLDVVGADVALLGQLRLRHLESFLSAPLLDGLEHLVVVLLRRHHVVGAVDFGQALAFGALICLKVGLAGRRR